MKNYVRKDVYDVKYKYLGLPVRGSDTYYSRAAAERRAADIKKRRATSNVRVAQYVSFEKRGKGSIYSRAVFVDQMTPKDRALFLADQRKKK